MMKKVLLKITGMHCTSCAFNIDGELEDTEGVVEARTNYAKQQAHVSFDQSKISVKAIQKVIQQTGYDTKLVE